MSKPDLDLTALRQAYEEERQGQRNRSVEWWLNHIRALLDALEQAQRQDGLLNQAGREQFDRAERLQTELEQAQRERDELCTAITKYSTVPAAEWSHTNVVALAEAHADDSQSVDEAEVRAERAERELAEAQAERGRAQAALRTVREHTSRSRIRGMRRSRRYLPVASYTLLVGLLESIERIVDAALTPDSPAPDGSE